jgi:hypothetical protein
MRRIRTRRRSFRPLLFTLGRRSQAALSQPVAQQTERWTLIAPTRDRQSEFDWSSCIVTHYQVFISQSFFVCLFFSRNEIAPYAFPNIHDTHVYNLLLQGLIIADVTFYHTQNFRFCNRLIVYILLLPLATPGVKNRNKEIRRNFIVVSPASVI